MKQLIKSKEDVVLILILDFLCGDNDLQRMIGQLQYK